jgi:hypothetical protein
MLVTDHPHLFETGGENYHTDFFGWEYLRGHEGDPWRTAPDPSWIGAPALPAARGAWWWERSLRGAEHAAPRLRPLSDLVPRGADFPGPKTMTAAAAWLRDRALRTTGGSCSSTSSTPTSPSTPQTVGRPLRGR